MSNPEMTKGFYQKYEVKKISNPDKILDCVVLEFDDVICRQGIKAFAESMYSAGYVNAAQEIFSKLRGYEIPMIGADND